MLESILISLAVSLICTAISILLTPTTKTTAPEPGELDVSTTEEGTLIPHIRGTRFTAVNCVWWTPTGTYRIKK